MSKRKKSYENRMYSTPNNIYYDETMVNPNNFNKSTYNYPNYLMNNMNGNINNVMDILNNIDFKNLNNMLSFMRDGFDINKASDFINKDINYNSGIYNENVINLLTSLKFVLKSEFNDIIDKFIQFYMDEINKEK